MSVSTTCGARYEHWTFCFGARSVLADLMFLFFPWQWAPRLFVSVQSNLCAALLVFLYCDLEVECKRGLCSPNFA